MRRTTPQIEAFMKRADEGDNKKCRDEEEIE